MMSSANLHIAIRGQLLLILSSLVWLNNMQPNIFTVSECIDMCSICLANQILSFRNVRLSKPYFFCQPTVFFAHDKSANNIFSHDFLDQRTTIFWFDYYWTHFICYLTFWWKYHYWHLRLQLVVFFHLSIISCDEVLAKLPRLLERLHFCCFRISYGRMVFVSSFC